MVKRVSLFQAVDGKTFETEALAKEHEATIAARATVALLLKKLKVDNSFITLGETDSIMLETFLLDNRTALLDALVGVKPEKKERKPRSAKKTPKAPAEPTLEAKELATQEQPVAETHTSGDDLLDSLVGELGA